MAKGIQRKIKEVLESVNEEIAISSRGGGFHARGLAGEGFAGGYRQALWDVQLALRGINPNSRYWKEIE